MKKFLSTLGIFLSLLLVTFLIFIGTRYIRGVHHVRKEFTLAPGKSVISISDSHGQHAFDEKVFPELQNFSRDSLNNWQVLMRLHRILVQNPNRRIRIALFTLSTHTLYSMGYNTAHSEQFMKFLPLTLPEIRYWPYGHFIDLVKAFHLNPKHAFITSRFVRPVKARQNTSLFETRPDAPFVEAILQRHYFNKRDLSGNREGELIYKKIYAQMIDLCIQNNILPVFITTPVHRLYREKVPASAQATLLRFRKELQARGALCLDYWSWPLTDADFYDADHLSLPGRQRLTREIRNRLLHTQKKGGQN